MKFPVTMPSMRVTGAAPAWVRERLEGPVRRVPVVHTGHDAAYVDDDGICLGLLTLNAVEVPCGIRTLLDDIPPDDVALVGGGQLVLGPLTVTVTRFIDPRVPQVTSVPVIADLPRSFETDLLRAGDPAAVPLLLGQGPGLTPYGDDVLCGWLATTIALGRTGGEVAATALRLAPSRTTLLSATLLACASRGEAIPELRRVLSGGSFDRLLAVGGTSGQALAVGMGLAA